MNHYTTYGYHNLSQLVCLSKIKLSKPNLYLSIYYFRKLKFLFLTKINHPETNSCSGSIQSSYFNLGSPSSTGVLYCCLETISVMLGESRNEMQLSLKYIHPKLLLMKKKFVLCLKGKCSNQYFHTQVLRTEALSFVYFWLSKNSIECCSGLKELKKFSDCCTKFHFSSTSKHFGGEDSVKKIFMT